MGAGILVEHPPLIPPIFTCRQVAYSDNGSENRGIGSGFSFLAWAFKYDIMRSVEGAQGPGGMAERPKAPVLKTGVGQPTVGSNPTPSAGIEYGEVPEWPIGLAC